MISLKCLASFGEGYFGFAQCLSFAECCFIFVDLPPPVPPPPVPRNRNIQKPTLPSRRLDTENMGKLGMMTVCLH